MARFKKGEGGRKKGQPNKITAALKDMILQALANAGGVDYLEARAKDNPTAFMALVGRVLPLQLKQGGGDPVVPKAIYHLHEGDEIPAPGTVTHEHEHGDRDSA